MSFKEALWVCLRYKLFNLRDRACRSEYWWFMLFAFVFQQIIGVLTFLPSGLLIVIALTLYVGWAQIAVTVRRLHDLNHSGKWLFVAYVPAFVGVFLLFSHGALDPATLQAVESGELQADRTLVLASYLTMFGFVLSFAVMLYCAKKGSDGANRFGPDPLQKYQAPNNIFGNPYSNDSSFSDPYYGQRQRQEGQDNNPFAHFFEVKVKKPGQYTQKDNGDFGFNANATEQDHNEQQKPRS